VAVLREVSVREALREVLLEGPATARDLSRRVGIPERDVPGHLEHIARSVSRQGQRLRIRPACCLDCDFVFEERRRYTRPGRCPACHSRRISLPEFEIESRGPVR